MWQRGKRAASAVLVLASIGAAVFAVYYGANGRAKEKEGPGKRGSPTVPVTVAPVRTQSVPLRLPAIGNVEAFATVSLKARIDGQIVAVLFKEGEPVTKGEVLFRIDPRPFEAALRQAEANALRDQAARDQARSQAKRYEELLAKNFVSKEAYAQIRTNAEIAGLGDQLGTIEAGKLADLIVVDQDPLQNLQIFEQGLRHVLLVMKEGVVVKDLLNGAG